MAWDYVKWSWPWTPTTWAQKPTMRDLQLPPYRKSSYSPPRITAKGSIQAPIPGSQSLMESLLKEQGMYGVPRVIPAIARAAESFSFVIELVTYTLYFFEEAFVMFMRGYADVLFLEDIGNIAWLSYVDFDYIFRWNLSYFYNWALFAVYSYNSFANYLYVLMMYREYANLLMSGEYLQYHFIHHFMWPTFKEV